MVTTEWDVKMLRGIPGTELSKCQLNLGVNNVFCNTMVLGSPQSSLH